jgi:hypothetical protein
VKGLEEDVALVSGQHDALNVQIRQASARVGTLTEEVKTLKGIVRERDDALSGIGREIETLRASVLDYNTLGVTACNFALNLVMSILFACFSLCLSSWNHFTELN